MQWLEKRENWIPGKPAQRPRKKMSKVYSVTEVAQILAVSRQTVFKWLSIDEPEYAVIPPEAWFRLLSGHIRIREWVVLKLQNQEV